MRLTRIYQPALLVTDSQCVLDERASHYLYRVLRAAVGDSLVLFNDQGREYSAEIVKMTRQAVIVVVGLEHTVTTESPLASHLFQALLRTEKMDFVLQKSVELGVTEITPVIMEHCNYKMNEDRLDRRLDHWRGVIISAAEQSGRARLPRLHPPRHLCDIDFEVISGKKIVLDPRATARFSMLHGESMLSLVIGPEGGISEGELRYLKDHSFMPISLGSRILRAETAGPVAIAVAQYCLGDLK